MLLLVCTSYFPRRLNAVARNAERCGHHTPIPIKGVQLVVIEPPGGIITPARVHANTFKPVGDLESLFFF